jgi:mono/diheme cytochrome c family protein
MTWARGTVVFLLGCAAAPAPVTHAQTAADSQRDGAGLYRTACAACHGPDGRGAPRATVGFDLALPDFTDCSFATPEADADWLAVVHDGGPARAFDRLMPAFGSALTETEIVRVVDHLRSFCGDQSWPRGDLNLPRPLVTEKAFPENEAVVTMSFSRGDARAAGSRFVYEHRVGSRGQYEVAVPVELRQDSGGPWRRGLGDVAVAYKHVLGHSLQRGAIVSAGGELILPTGKESEGLGGGTTVLEPFGTYSQMLPRDAFLHAHAGLELPLGAEGTAAESFWRATVGKTVSQRRWGRAWSPMIEVLGARELEARAPVDWDVVPQMQVSLSTRQHVLLNAGVRVPVNRREGRSAALLVYLLWDWFDGSVFSGW